MELATETSQPTFEATVEPTVVVEPTLPPPVEEPEDPNSDVVGGLTSEQLFAIFAAIVFLAQGLFNALKDRNHAALFAKYQAALERKQVRDEAEAAFQRSAIPVKDAILMVKSILTAAGNFQIPILDQYIDEGAEFLDDVTDGEANS